MRTVLANSLRMHLRRYVAAAAAVVVSVVFLLTTAALGESARSGIDEVVGLPYGTAEAVVGWPEPALVTELHDTAGVEVNVVGGTDVPVTFDGVPLGGDTSIAEITPDAFGWQTLTAGTFPTAPGQTVLDVHEADTQRVGVGDVVRIGAGARARDMVVVGLAETPQMTVSPTAWVLWEDLSDWVDELGAEAVQVTGAGGFDAAARLVQGVDPDVVAQAPDMWVADLQESANHGIQVMQILLLVFAGVALFVSAVVIGNNFSILFAQRQRDLALLRCVGATRRQVQRSIRVEALAIGAGASLLGLLLGTVSAFGLVALVRRLLPDVAFGAARIEPLWYLAALAVGTLVTVVAAWLPARTAVRVGPLAALRPVDQHGVSSRTGRVRLALGTVAAAGGAGLLAWAVRESSVEMMLLGGAVNATGVLLLTPVVVPASVRVLGVAFRALLGTPGRLATANTLANPRRSAATTSALLIGVTLTVAVLTSMDTIRTVIGDEQDASHPVDGMLSSVVSRPTEGEPDTVARRIASTPGVQQVVAVPGVTVTVSPAADDEPGSGTEGALPVSANAVPLPTGPDRDVWRGALPVLTGDEFGYPMALLAELGLPTDEDGQSTLTVGGHTFTGTPVVVDGTGTDLLLGPAAWQELAARADGARPRTVALWWRAVDGADAERIAAVAGSAAAGSGTTFTDGLAERAWVDLQLTTITSAVLGLLAVSVLIALTGISNALGLSVLERSRENALLRALGLRRRQLAATLSVEALMLGLVAGSLGTAAGVGYAWVATRTVLVTAVGEVGLHVPWWQLATVVALSAAAALAASLVPARRAARTAPAQGLALD